MEEQPNPGIISDPEKMKKQIKTVGSMGIFLGILMLIMSISITSMMPLIGIILIIFSLVFLYLAISIRRNPATSNQTAQYAWYVTIAYVALGVLAGGKAPILFLLYLWGLHDVKKFQKRIADQQAR